MKFSLDFAKLMKLDYWFNPNPGSGQLFFLSTALLISVLLLIAGVGVWYLKKKYFLKSVPKRNFWTQVMWTLYSFSVVSWFLTFFRLEGLGAVSIRILWPILGLALIGTMVYFFIDYQIKVPAQLNRIETENLKKKYFRTKKSARSI